MSGRLLAIFLPSGKCPGKLGTRVLFSLFQAGGETLSAVPRGKQWGKGGVTWSSWTNPSRAGLYFSFPAVISMRKNTQLPEVPSASHPHVLSQCKQQQAHHSAQEVTAPSAFLGWLPLSCSADRCLRHCCPACWAQGLHTKCTIFSALPGTRSCQPTSSCC